MKNEDELKRRRLEIEGMKHKILRIQYALKSKEAALQRLAEK
jgi:hypothetical protein